MLGTHRLLPLPQALTLATIGLLVRPTPVEHIVAVGDAEDRMPEKSTYFFPKPVTGLVIASLDGTVGG